MGVCGYSVPKRNKGNKAPGPTVPENMAPGWRQNKRGLRGFDPPRAADL